ncbi:hypothetical protein K400107F7_09950 [Agathobaculum massiliense]
MIQISFLVPGETPGYTARYAQHNMSPRLSGTTAAGFLLPDWQEWEALYKLAAANPAVLGEN